MSSVWQAISRFLNEAPDPLQGLIRHVERHYGEHEADNIQDIIKNTKPELLARTLGVHYSDNKIDAFVAKMLGTDKEKPSAQPMANRGGSSGGGWEDPTLKDKGSFGAEPIPTRPDRAGMQGTTPPPRVPVAHPRSKDFQQVGSAGQGMPNVQPSQQELPSKIGKELDKLYTILRKIPPGAAGEILRRKVKKRIEMVGQAGVSTVKNNASMSSDKFYKQGGSRKDIEDMSPAEIDAMRNVKTGAEPQTAAEKDAAKKIAVGPRKIQRPPNERGKGMAVGTRWMANAFSSSGGKDIGMTGGLGATSFSHKNAATGAIGYGQHALNPAKAGNKVTGQHMDPVTGKDVKTKWSDSHEFLWGGDALGWLLKSEFVAAIASGKIPRKNTSPTKPDISGHRVLPAAGTPKPRPLDPDKK